MNEEIITEVDSPEITGPDIISVAAKEAAQKAASLKEELDDCKTLKKFLDELMTFRDKGWILHLKALCDREVERLNRLRESGNICIASIDDLYQQAKQEAKRTPIMFPSNIERLANAKEIVIDRKSRHPRYFFGKDGFLEARVDDQKVSATISSREGKITTLPADPEAILEIVTAELKRLFEREFNGIQFLANMRKAYLAGIKLIKDAQDGDPIPLREIYKLMAKEAKGYKRDEFLIDLSTLVDRGPSETSGYKFNLQQTKDTQEGVLLLGAAGSGMVSLMVFKKSNSKTS